MSRVVEETMEVDLQEGDELTTIDDSEAVESEVAAEAASPEQSFNVPDKFKDKTIEDVVKSYQELETAFGRKNNELGEARKVADELMQLELQAKRNDLNKTVEAQPSLDVDSLLDNPEIALNNAIDSNPRLKKIEEQLLNQSRDKQKSAFESKHSDWQDLMNDNDFTSWVQGSRIRSEQFKKAHTQYDYEMADELFSTYKQIKGVQHQVQDKADSKRASKLKTASVETGSTGAKTTKIFRRGDLINLRQTNPAKYEAMEDEIYRAYEEGRVR